MIYYAVSTGSLNGVITPQLADAFRRSKVKNVGLDFCYRGFPQETLDLSVKLAQELIAEDQIRPLSIHLPSWGYDRIWDPSCLDETERHQAVQSYIDLFHERGAQHLLAPRATLHSSGEWPMAEHAKRVDQACKTIEEIIPTAQEYGVCICVEFLPRTCVGHDVADLLKLTERFDADQVGICLDVNHIMNRHQELPDMINTMASRIKSFHICDYDGIDETHWFAGQGIIDWPKVMKAIRAIDHDVVLISETQYQLGKYFKRDIDPWFSLKQVENTFWFLENCEEIVARQNAFQIPGNC